MAGIVSVIAKSNNYLSIGSLLSEPVKLVVDVVIPNISFVSNDYQQGHVEVKCSQPITILSTSIPASTSIYLYTAERPNDFTLIKDLTAFVDTFAPNIQLVSPQPIPTITAAGTQNFTLRISDALSDVKASTLVNGFYVRSPSGIETLLTKISGATANTSSLDWVLRYDLTSFNSANNGTYGLYAKSTIADALNNALGSPVLIASFSVNIEAIAVIAAPVISAIANQSRTADGSAFSLTPTNTGGAVSTWSATGLPTGFSINSSTGAIAGTLNTVATSNITIIATNAGGSDSKSFSLAVASPLAAPSISPIGSQPRSADGSTFSLTPTNTGGTASSWSATGLPAGFSINSSTGAITGTLNTSCHEYDHNYGCKRGR